MKNISTSLADLLYESKDEIKEFRRNPSEYLEELVGTLRRRLVGKVGEDGGDERKELEVLRKLENLSIQVKYIPYT